MSGEVRQDDSKPNELPEAAPSAEGEKANEAKLEQSPEEIEKQQEAQLRSKYPGIKGPGSSAILQKRLSKGTKYFDSGDYNMAKAKVGPTSKQTLAPGQKLLLSNSTGDTIPTPESVPHKKLNMHQSKLAGMS